MSQFYKRRLFVLRTETNTYSAGAILDYLPKFTRNRITNIVVHPQHDDTPHRGGVSFELDMLGVNMGYKVIHNWGDLFDMHAINLDNQEEESVNDIFAGDFIATFEELEVMHEEWNQMFQSNIVERLMEEE
tara:strand:- start:1276 stop:1668 length:393 start_codon:yes stop_codon:yes gene_type:complete